jgi:ABC-type transport system involved in multi-copper enzyme maturation permease subunit
MSALFTITRLTIHEAARRRVLVAALLCGLGFLVLFAIGLHFIVLHQPRRGMADLLEARTIFAIFTIAGLYAANFLTVMTAVLLPVDTLSGEIASGVMQTIASKPIRRSSIVLGKWLGFAILIAGYLTLLAGGVVGIVKLRADVLPPNLHLGIPLMLLEGLLLLTVSIAGGTRFSTVTTGVLAFGLYGFAFLGGWVEQIATYTNNDAVRTVGTVASLVMPSEAMWQMAANFMQPPVVRALGAGPFSYAVVPSTAMVWWAVGYVGVTLLVALRQFSKRPL